MQTVHTIEALRHAVQEARHAGHRIGFVPTMGNLHEGHLSLIDVATSHSDYVVSSIFVNPMQFGANEDLDAYPRTLEADKAGLASRGCRLLFAPNVGEVYPNGLEAETRVAVPVLGDYHCGASRAGHFEGVATVVSKLFNMVQPDLAVFGKKDYQQLAIIRKMVTDLCFPVKVLGVDTSREESGLARSSRNGYLSDAERLVAPEVYRSLIQAREQLLAGKLLEETQDAAKQYLESKGFKVDYFNIADQSTLQPALETDRKLVLLVAAFLGSTRLIDNLEVER